MDIIFDVLKAVVDAQPHSTFARSLFVQYQERGGLSKKQLQGLHNKAQKVKDIAPAKMATLEAIILKKPTREKAPAPKLTAPVYQKDEAIGQAIKTILTKYPAHKRVLYFQSRYNNNEALSPIEVAELQRFAKLLK